MNPTTPQPPTTPPQGPVSKEAGGIHFIGANDPKSLSLEEFDKSPELLYHPCQRAFTFIQQFDSNLPEYFLESGTSQTLGQGFYTTSDKSEAEARSKAKQGQGATVPILISLLPYQARIFDFRDRLDPSQNGPVPTSMAQRWFQYFTDYFHSPERENLPWTTTEPENRYYLYLKEIITIPTTDLRAMLGTIPSPQSPNMAIPSWSKLFANFIMREGMEGIIYNEPSLATPGKTSPIVVFYSLAKVGTFESWHTTTPSMPQRPS